MELNNILNRHNMKHTAQEIYKAIEESIFEEKYGIPLKLALAAPELLEALNDVLANTAWHAIQQDTLGKARQAIKKATP